MDQALEQINLIAEADGETELILDDIEFKQFTPELKEKIEKLAGLEQISLNNCGLSSLKNFPNCPNLSSLEIGENQFPASDLMYISGLKDLGHLDLHDCQIETIEDLAPLKDLPNLYSLDIIQTPFSEKKDFRKEIYDLLQEVQVVNGVDRQGNPVNIGGEDDEDDDEEGYSDDSDEDDEEEEEFDSQEEDEDDVEEDEGSD